VNPQYDKQTIEESGMHAVARPARVPAVVTKDRGDSDMRQNTTRQSLEEREAFAAVVREHDRNLRMLVYRLLGDADVMDDVLQDAYLRAYRGLSDFRRDASLATWLYRITYNLCLDCIRGRARLAERTAPLSLDAMAEGGSDPALHRSDPTAGIVARSELERTLSQLAPEQRAAVLLVDAIGYDYSTASQILGVREGTLASRLHQSRALLRHALSETG
jgi:RNA polymerase sigma-70 factor, ECF subfamily